MRIYSSKFLTNKQYPVNILFILCLIYFSIGFFPIAPIESDGNGIANGAAVMAIQGLGANDLSYRYEAQPGAYAFTVWLHKLSGLNTLSAFSILSGLAALVFILVCAAFIARMTTTSLATCGLALLLFQESYTGGYYSNPTVIAAAFLIVGLYLLANNSGVITNIYAGFMLGLSAWVRFDSILVMPVILILIRRETWKRYLFQLSLTVVIAILTALIAMEVSNMQIINISETLNSHLATQHSTTKGLGIALIGDSSVKSHLAFFTFLILILLGIGNLWLIKNRKWNLVYICILGIFPLYGTFLQWGAITSPKYLYYLLPFWGLLAVSGIQAVILNYSSLRRISIVILVCLFLAQYIIGLRVKFSSKPYISLPYPTLLSLFTVRETIPSVSDASFVAGAGTYISTVDSNRMLSGIIFAPLSWNHTKSEFNYQVTKLKDYIDDLQKEEIIFLADDYDSRQLGLNILLNLGYHCGSVATEQVEEFHCTRLNQRITLVMMPHNPERDVKVLSENLRLVNQSSLIFVVATDWERYLLEQFLALSDEWKGNKISSLAFELYR